jgi:hypothetical protein
VVTVCFLVGMRRHNYRDYLVNIVSGNQRESLPHRSPASDPGPPNPVSGFFMMRSEVADKAAPRLSGVATKILIDLLAPIPGRCQ